MTAYLDVKQEFLGYRQYSRLIVRGVRNAHPVLLGKMNKVVIQIWSSHLNNCGLKHAIEIRRPDPSRVIAVAGEAYLTVFINEQKSAKVRKGVRLGIFVQNAKNALTHTP